MRARLLRISLRIQNRSYVMPLFALYVLAVVIWIVVLAVR